ncbi:MAG: carbonic anhydrase, partial [Planctomycetota bacterium]
DEIAQKHKLSREQKLEVLAAENVKLQIKHLQSLALIKNMHEKGSLPRIHGWLYRVETGAIDILVNGRTGKVTKGFKSLESMRS